ncbi:aspartyl protease family protein [Pedobacter rhodius]|uniref:Aspartyl protease family protein n=1 Tax=Pedobacter rhodius TaxID=3004098 RepID=A0ABT4KZ10_9SPHI|nr:aspartyl protease family protein [Pedobacter sp. SJ11]MCZ4224154.1 aspartyl protease family protein [Pedobacter sp. SJ11]
MLTKYKFIRLAIYRKLMICAGFILLFSNALPAQDFAFPGNQKRQSLHFKLIKNLIIIPVYINEKGPYDFVLDTGVGPLIITEPSIIDTLNFAKMRKIKVSGLGLETVEAFVSQNISARIGMAEAQHMPTAILKEDLFNLSGHLGVKIYGLVGFNFFNSFVVDVRYTESRMIFSNPGTKIKYKGSKIPILIENLKPYVYAEVDAPDVGKIKAKLLMDTGASHALSMETFNGDKFPLPYSKIKANLGMSLSGQIKGYLGRVKELSIGEFDFKDVISGFPDYKIISQKIDLKTRNGNLGADLLRKFNIQFNYREGFIYVRPNGNFKMPFEHDMVGMVVYLDQKEYKRFFIGEVDENSPAEKSGLCPDDEIIGVNFRSMEMYSLNELSELFKSGANRSIILEIYRDKQVFFKVIHLEKRI